MFSRKLYSFFLAFQAAHVDEGVCCSRPSHPSLSRSCLNLSNHIVSRPNSAFSGAVLQQAGRHVSNLARAQRPNDQGLLAVSCERVQDASFLDVNASIADGSIQRDPAQQEANNDPGL